MNQNLPSCRFCGTELEHIFADLGETPLANRNLLHDQIADERKYPLVARVCGACFLVQVDHSVSPDDLFSDYDYFSSYSESWIAHANRYCDGMRERFTIGTQSFVVEIASNDGYLLQHFKGVEVLGVEPAANVAKAAIARAMPTSSSPITCSRMLLTSGILSGGLRCCWPPMASLRSNSLICCGCSKADS